jgi:hypothetical protein
MQAGRGSDAGSAFPNEGPATCGWASRRTCAARRGGACTTPQVGACADLNDIDQLDLVTKPTIEDVGIGP